VLEADAGSNLLQLGNRNSAAIGSTDESADAGAGDKADRYVFFFEDFQNTDMSDAAGKAAAQRYANCGCSLRFGGRRTP